jgi:outer membrane receptor protein involved in Fe transport
VRAANCAAALASFSTTPQEFHATTAALSPLGTVSGNPNLDNETSDSWSVGFVYQPTVAPRFRFAADWSHIKLEGGIESLSINQVLGACYDSPNFPNSPECDPSVFRRLTASEVGPGTDNPTRIAGDIANGYNTGFINTSSLEFAGLIVVADYGFDLGQLNGAWDNAGDIRLSAKMFYTGQYDTVSFPGQPVFDSVGNVGTPRYSAQFSVNYTRDKFDLYLQTLWTSSTKNDTTLDNTTLEDHFNNVPAYWRFNASVGYQITKQVSARFTVNNLFDTGLSDSQLLSQSFGTYDLIGRSYLFNLSASF